MKSLDLSQPHMKNVFFVLIFVQFLFSINFITSKIVVSTVSPFAFASARFLISGICLLLYAFFFIKKRPFVTMPHFWPKVFFLSFLGVTLSQVLFLSGLKQTSSINTSVITITIPIFTLFISFLRKQVQITHWKLLGFIFSFLGVFCLKKFEEMSFNDLSFHGDLLVFGSCITMALFISLSKNFFSQCNTVWGSGILFLIGGLYLLPFVWQEHIAWPNWHDSLHFYLALSFSIFGATLLTYYLNNWAIQFMDPDYVALFIYLQPVMCTLLAWIFLHETITVRTILSMFFVVLGMIFALKSKIHS